MALVGQTFGQADDNVGVVNISLASFAAGQFLLITLTDDNDSTTEVPDVDIGGVTLSPNRSFGPWGSDNQTDFVFSRVLTAADITAGQVVITPDAGSDWKNISANATAWTGRSGALAFNTEQVSVGAVSGTATMTYGTLTPQAGSDVVAVAFTDNVGSLQDKDFQDITDGGGSAGFTETVDPTDVSWASQFVGVKESVAATATGTLSQQYTGSGSAGWRTLLIELPAAAAAPTAAITGTAVGSNTESSIAANNKTLIITLTNGTWLTAGASFDAQRQAILDSFVSDVTEANGFNEERANVALSNVVRASDTVVTITLNDMSAIDVAETHTISNTGIPAAAIDGASAAVTPPETFTITEDPVTESITPVEFAQNQPFQRIYDGSTANVPLKPFAYTSIVGVSTLEYRLLAADGTTVRQDWTVATNLTLGATGTATMSVPTSRDSYRYQLRTKDSGGTVLATSAIMANEFRAGIGVGMTGDSDPSGFMNQGPAQTLANGVWRFNNTSNAWENTGATIAIGAIILIANQLAIDEDCAVFLVDATKVGGGLVEFQSPGGAMYDELLRIRNACETDLEIMYQCLGANDVFSGTLVYSTVLGQYNTLKANLRSFFGANLRIPVIPPSRDDSGGNDANWTTVRRADKDATDADAQGHYSASMMWEAMESFHYPDTVEQNRGKDILLQTARFILGSAAFFTGPTVSWSIDGSNLATVNFTHNGTDITASGTDNGLDFKNNGTPVGQSTVTKVNGTTVTVQLAGPANQLSIGEGAIPFPTGEGIVDNVSFGLASTGLVAQPVFDLAPAIQVSQSLSSSFSVLNYVNQSIAAASTVRNYVNQAVSSAHTVRNYINQSMVSASSLRNYAGNSLSAANSVRSYVSNALASGFSVESTGTVTQQLSSGFSVRGYVNNTLSGSNTTRSFVSNTLSSSNAVRNYVNNTLAMAGSVRAYANQAYSASYSVRNYVQSDLTGGFSVSGVVYVSSTLQSSNTVRQYIAQTLLSSFTVNYEADDGSTSNWPYHEIADNILSGKIPAGPDSDIFIKISRRGLRRGR